MKTKKNEKGIMITTLVIAFTMMLSSFSFMITTVKADTPVFPDVDLTASYAKPVYWAAEKDYVRGYSNGDFGPSDSCTRQQFVVILWRMAGRPSSGDATNPFSDVDSSTSGYKAILWAINEGIIKGFDDGTFRPTEPVTRAQVVMMLWRQEGRPTVSGGKSFSDVPSSISAYKPVMWGSGSGVVKGFSDGTFRPSEDCTRAQIVTFFYRYYRDVKGESVSVDLPGSGSGTASPEQPESTKLAERETKKQEEKATKPAEQEATKPAESETTKAAEQETTKKQEEQTTAHVHSWEKITKIVHHDAEYTTVHHEAEYTTKHHEAEYEEVWHEPVVEQQWVVTVPAHEEEIWKVHTVCDCGFDMTVNFAGMSKEEKSQALNEHLDQCGYGGWGTKPVLVGTETIPEQGYYADVTITEGYSEKVLIKKAYDEKVLVKEAYDEKVVTGYKCSACGATK